MTETPKTFNPDATQPISQEDRNKLEEMLKSAQAAKENAASAEQSAEELISEWEKKGIIDRSGHLKEAITDNEIDKAFDDAKVITPDAPFGSTPVTDADFDNTVLKDKPVEDEAVEKMFDK